jgi:hypothetical protein
MVGFSRAEVEVLESEIERKLHKKKKFYNPKGKAAKKKSAEVASRMRERAIRQIEEKIKSQLERGDLRNRIIRENSEEKREKMIKALVNWIVDSSDGDWKIGEEEIEFEYTRAKGAGGQHVNKVQTAVRAVHVFTGITAEDQNSRERSENEKQAIGHLIRKLQIHLDLWRELLANDHGLRNVGNFRQRVDQMVTEVVYTKEL